MSRRAILLKYLLLKTFPLARQIMRLRTIHRQASLD